MKKTLKKILAVALTGMIALSMCACGGSGDNGGSGSGETGDKTVINVYNYNGGFGTQWLYEVAEEYEKVNTNVTIKITPKKTSTPTSSDIKSGKNELYFIENVDLYTFKADGAIDPITEAVTTANKYDNGKTIISKMTTEQQNYFSINGEYYAVPHYRGNYGLTYNVDMFDENCWYFADGKVIGVDGDINEPENLFIVDEYDTKSAGPDGDYGTEDDGLPTTYEEFLILLKYIHQTKPTVIPYGVNGAYHELYVGALFNQFVAENEGAEQMKLNFTFDGVATDLGTINSDGEFVLDDTPTTITEANGYECARQQGKYQAIDFFVNLFADTDNYSATNAVKSSYQYTQVQNDFIRGGYAILDEGVWWQNEADDANTFKNYNNSTKFDYKFGWMPIPCATQELADDRANGVRNSTIIDMLYSACFMKAGLSPEKKAAIYDFIQFVYSDAMLVKYTQVTGTLKALNYTLTDDEMSALTYYEQSMIKYCTREDVDTVYGISNNDTFVNNKASFELREYYKATIGNTTDGNPVWYFLDEKSPSHTAGAYVKAMTEYYKTRWASEFYTAK